MKLNYMSFAFSQHKLAAYQLASHVLRASICCEIICAGGPILCWLRCGHRNHCRAA